MATESKSLLSNQAYDTVKWIAQYVLPALGTLYFAVAKIWNLPYGEEVLGTITAVDLFLAAILGISKKSYNENEDRFDGAMVVNTTDPMKDTYTVVLDIPITEIEGKSELVLKVDNQSPSQD